MRRHCDLDKRIREFLFDIIDLEDMAKNISSTAEELKNDAHEESVGLQSALISFRVFCDELAKHIVERRGFLDRMLDNSITTDKERRFLRSLF